jgi:hypothetical protein
MSPNHKGETSGGGISGDKVVLDILVYGDISRVYTMPGIRHVLLPLVDTSKPHLRFPHHWIQREKRHRLVIDLVWNQSAIATTPDQGPSI